MGLALIHFTLRVGYAWILLNLAAISSLAILFSLQETLHTIRQRSIRAHRTGEVICIARR